MKIENLRMTKSQKIEVLENMTDTLDRTTLSNFIQTAINENSNLIQYMLDYFDDTDALDDALVYSEIIKEEDL